MLVFNSTVNVGIIRLQVREEGFGRDANDGAKIVVVVLTHEQAV